jgi:hypothetical protein
LEWLEDRLAPTVTPSFAAPQTFPGGSGFNSVAVADVNGDGNPDLITANGSAGPVSVLLNTTAPGATVASFAPPQTFNKGDNPNLVAVAHFNGDGRPDLITAKVGGTSVSVLLNTTASGAVALSFAPPQTFPTGPGLIFLAVADLNGDGKPDLITTDTMRVFVLLNTTAPGAAALSFAPPQTAITTASGVGNLVMADLNGDGKPDLIITPVTTTAAAFVLLNTTAPGATTLSFAPQQTIPTAGLAVGDLNGDGKLDLINTTAGLGANTGVNSVSVLLNTTAPGATVLSFAPPQTFPLNVNPVSLAVGDVNGDGKPDLLVGNLNTPNGPLNTVSVLPNTGAPGATVLSFAPPQTFNTGGEPLSVTLADVNGDAKPDLITNNVNNGVSVLLNTAAFVGPTTVYVNPAFTGPAGSDPDGNGPATAIGFDAFASLQPAIDAVAPGGTVMVAAGTYTGGLTLAKRVIVQGSGSTSTFVAGTGTGTGLAITGQGVAASGLTVRGFGTGLLASGGNYLALSDVGLTNNTFGGAVNGVATFLFGGGAGNETFFVRPGLLARQGDNPLAYSGVQNLTVDGGGGNNILVVSLNDISTADTVWLNNVAVARDKAPFLLWYRATGGSFGGGLTVVLGDGPETVVVQSQLAGTPTTVFGQGGDDTFFVAVVASSAYANLTLDGGPGNDALAVFDMTGGASLQDRVTVIGQGQVSASYSAGSESTISYQNVEQILGDLPVA